MPTDETGPTGPSSLQQELAQRIPFRSPAQEALVGIARTASVTQRATNRLLVPHGISTAQYNVLRILRGAGPDGLPTLTIRERLIDPAAAITRLTEKLAEAGLINRERTAADRRQVTCRISEAGLSMLAALDPMIDGLDGSFEAALSESELVTFNRMMDRIRTELGTRE